MKKITRQYWDMIPMPDIVIERVYLLGKYQPYLLLYTYFKGWLIGYGDSEITGVDGDENWASLLQNIENNNINNQEDKEDQEEFHT